MKECIIQCTTNKFKQSRHLHIAHCIHPLCSPTCSCAKFVLTETNNNGMIKQNFLNKCMGDGDCITLLLQPSFKMECWQFMWFSHVVHPLRVLRQRETSPVHWIFLHTCNTWLQSVSQPWSHGLLVPVLCIDSVCLSMWSRGRLRESFLLTGNTHRWRPWTSGRATRMISMQSMMSIVSCTHV